MVIEASANAARDLNCTSAVIQIEIKCLREKVRVLEMAAILDLMNCCVKSDSSLHNAVRNHPLKRIAHKNDNKRLSSDNTLLVGSMNRAKLQ